jgi:transcription elongation factor Elf1
LDDQKRPKPLPCPWCGHDVTVATKGKYDWVKCFECGAEGPMERSADPVESWNRVVEPLARMRAGESEASVAADVARAEEREACAVVCDEYSSKLASECNRERERNAETWARGRGAWECAAAIRGRG